MSDQKQHTIGMTNSAKDLIEQYDAYMERMEHTESPAGASFLIAHALTRDWEHIRKYLSAHSALVEALKGVERCHSVKMDVPTVYQAVVAALLLVEGE